MYSKKSKYYNRSINIEDDVYFKRFVNTFRYYNPPINELKEIFIYSGFNDKIAIDEVIDIYKYDISKLQIEVDYFDEDIIVSNFQIKSSDEEYEEENNNDDNDEDHLNDILLITSSHNNYQSNDNQQNNTLLDNILEIERKNESSEDEDYSNLLLISNKNLKDKENNTITTTTTKSSEENNHIKIDNLDENDINFIRNLTNPIYTRNNSYKRKNPYSNTIVISDDENHETIDSDIIIHNKKKKKLNEDDDFSHEYMMSLMYPNDNNNTTNVTNSNTIDLIDFQKYPSFDKNDSNDNDSNDNENSDLFITHEVGKSYLSNRIEYHKIKMEKSNSYNINNKNYDTTTTTDSTNSNRRNKGNRKTLTKKIDNSTISNNNTISKNNITINRVNKYTYPIITSRGELIQQNTNNEIKQPSSPSEKIDYDNLLFLLEHYKKNYEQ